MNKLYITILFLFVALTSNAQQYPTIQNLKSDFSIVSDYIQSDIKFIEITTEEKLTVDQRKNLENVFYNKYKHIAGSENLDNFGDVAESTIARFKEVIGPKAFEKLSEKENAILILSGRVYLNPNGLN